MNAIQKFSAVTTCLAYLTAGIFTGGQALILFSEGKPVLAVASLTICILSLCAVVLVANDAMDLL